MPAELAGRHCSAMGYALATARVAVDEPLPEAVSDAVNRLEFWNRVPSSFGFAQDKQVELRPCFRRLLHGRVVSGSLLLDCEVLQCARSENRVTGAKEVLVRLYSEKAPLMENGASRRRRKSDGR